MSRKEMLRQNSISLERNHTYRDRDQKEVDLIFDINQILYPIGFPSAENVTVCQSC